MMISKLPDVLAIHLKRFKSGKGNKIKLTKKIKYPINYFNPEKYNNFCKKYNVFIL